MKRSVAALVVLLALLPAAGSQSEGDQGPDGATVLVRIRIRGPIPGSRTTIVDRDKEACGQTVTVRSAIVDPASRGVQDAAVWIDMSTVPQTDPAMPASTETEHKSPPSSLTNRACRFEPPVLLAQVGRQVEVRNDDAILHNTHIAGPDRTFLNVALPAGISPVAKMMKAEGIYLVRCDAHPFMSATVVSLGHSLAGVTGRDGAARISGVPAGQYTVRVWHAALGTLRQTLTVPARGIVTVTLEYGE